MYALVRRAARELGRRLMARGVIGAPDVVFFLRAEEAADAFAGRLRVDEVKGRARRGRRVMRGFARFKNPNEVGARHAVHKKAAPVGEGALRGIPCSSGVAEGAARVATCLDEARGLVAGELLVAAYTDPGWTPLFSRIAGVVTETGGLLSHAAVIAREYGIPAVLAVPEVTSAVKSGELVRVDGSAGTVERPVRAS
jgi:phosphohistidine swiveling domain-containing protein